MIDRIFCVVSNRIAVDKPYGPAGAADSVVEVVHRYKGTQWTRFSFFQVATFCGKAFSEIESAFSGSGKNYLGELKLVKLQQRSSAATPKFWSAPPSAITSPKFNNK